MKYADLLAPVLALAALAASALVSPAQAAPANRCGWVINPTPGNWWLLDAQGEWTLAMQGGYQAPGMENLPDYEAGGWVKTNGFYGYGCGCMKVESNARTKKITRVYNGRPLPLARCRADRKLPRPD